MLSNLKIGRVGISMALNLYTNEDLDKLKNMGYSFCRGSVGTMDAQKIITAIETAAKREEVINNSYREEHALFHAILEAITGICRGNVNLGNIMRTVGLNFAVIRGPISNPSPKGDSWISVVLYGTIGAPIKGFEHETIGMGINHL
ncbi:MAG: HutP family protein [Dehalobacterium sp.]